MATAWEKVAAKDVRPGDEVRLDSGQQLIVSRIEASFMGMPEMLAFIQDTPDRWFKQPLRAAATVEARRAT